MDEAFGVRLREHVYERGPLCVGVDPSPALLGSWGRNDDVEGLEFFALAVLEAVGDAAVAIKPQVAYFERRGSAGLRVLERLVAEARDAELLVVADAKRGDFTATNAAYAEAWLGEGSPLAVDALTVHPYLGVDALAPFFETARANGRGVFVLAATSNDEGRTLQRATTEDGDAVEDHVLASVASWNRRAETNSFGVVLGATRAAPRFDLSELGGPFLVPGLGEQGGDAGDVRRLFSGVAKGSVLASVSRGVLSAGPEGRALRDRARRWRDDLLEAL